MMHIPLYRTTVTIGLLAIDVLLTIDRSTPVLGLLLVSRIGRVVVGVVLPRPTVHPIGADPSR